MLLRRALMVSAGGVAVVIVQAVVLGNQWVTQWAYEHDFLESNLGSYIKSIMFFPRWRLTPGGSFKFMLVVDLGLLLFFVLLAALTAVGVMRMDPTRDVVMAFICGWWATFLAAAVASFVTQVLGGIVLDFPAQIRFAVVGGLEYGFAAGPLLGLAVAAAYLLTRPKAAPAWPSEPPGEPAGA